MADVLWGRGLRRDGGRERVGEDLPFAASLAKESTSSFSGIPSWPGVHMMWRVRGSESPFRLVSSFFFSVFAAL